MNKIREVPGYESIIVTHTDQPELYVWSLERQPDRAQDRVRIKQGQAKHMSVTPMATPVR